VLRRVAGRVVCCDGLLDASALSRAALPAGDECRLEALSKLGLEALSTLVLELSATPLALSSAKLTHAVHFAGADAGAELAMGIDALSSGADGSDR